LLDNGPTPSGVACSSDGECGSGMCCVRYPMSRKRQQSSYSGYCRNEGKLNETCDRHGKYYLKFEKNNLILKGNYLISKIIYSKFS
jgi:hypothetical protein